jgi:cytochrome b involved in lipid metabolism
MRVTPSQLKLHNTPEDAWSSFEGKVYNITPYLTFHPGGQKELMRAAGRDGTKLFGETFLSDKNRTIDPLRKFFLQH